MACAALQFDCSGTAFGVSARVAGTSTTPTQPSMLVRIDVGSGAAAPLCVFSTQPTAGVRVVVFLDASTILHFVGDASPAMEVLATANVPTNPGAVAGCAVVAVPAYAANARSRFRGVPVLAAAKDTTTAAASARVIVVAGSPSTLFAATRSGDVTPLSAQPVGVAGSLLSPYALAYTKGKADDECSLGAGECHSVGTH